MCVAVGAPSLTSVGLRSCADGLRNDTRSVARGRVLPHPPLDPGWLRPAQADSDANPLADVDKTGLSSIACATSRASVRFAIPGTVPAMHPVMMANELARHVAARGPSFSLPTSADLIEVADAVPFSMSDAYATVSPVLPRMVSIVDPIDSRMQPTARVGGLPFRRGAEAPTSSSLAIFVFIGLFVGLCAFAAMSIALPDSVPTKTTAMKSTVVAPAAKAVTPTVQAIKVSPQLIITDAPAETASTKPSPVRRRAIGAKRASTKTGTLASNPSNLP